MARFNEILVGRYNRFLQKLLEMKGGPPAPQLSTEIQPSFDIEQIPVELRVLMSFDRYWFNTFVPAVAANDASIQIRNPAGSNLLAVFEALSFGTQTPGQVVWSIGNGSVGDLTNLFLPNRQDNRSGSTRTPLVFSSQNTASPGTDLATPNGQTAVVPGTTPIIVAHSNQELVLAPNNAWRFRFTTVNTVFYFYSLFRCRALEVSETLVT